MSDPKSESELTPGQALYGISVLCPQLGKVLAHLHDRIDKLEASLREELGRNERRLNLVEDALRVEKGRH